MIQNQLVGLDAEIREETLRLNAERDEQILALQREEKMLQQPKFQRKAPSYCTGPRQAATICSALLITDLYLGIREGVYIPEHILIEMMYRVFYPLNHMDQIIRIGSLNDLWPLHIPPGNYSPLPCS